MFEKKKIIPLIERLITMHMMCSWNNAKLTIELNYVLILVTTGSSQDWHNEWCGEICCQRWPSATDTVTVG